MGLVLTLRQDEKKSYFKELMMEILVKGNADEILLCSGYIQEDMYSFFASSERDMSGNTFIGSVKNFKTVSIVGHKGKAGSMWDSSFIKFVNTIKTLSTGKVTGYISVERNWHAKVAIILRDGEPIAGVIGSSNMTRPAYGSASSVSTYTNYNMEADVFIYAEDVEKLVYYKVSDLRGDSYEEAVFADFNPGLNGNLSEKELLK